MKFSNPLSETPLVPLVSLLEEMIFVHQELLVLLQREKKWMIAGELEDLLSGLQQKEAAVVRLRHLEEKRQDLLDTIGETTLTALIQRTPEPDRSRLVSCQTRLQSLTSSIQEINQINGLLVERILDQIATLTGLLRHLSSASPVYQSNGRVIELQASGRKIGKG
ncbi:MAG: flagellar protein FlgN [Candidatus Manganitrophaceae bacterium]